MSNRPFRMPLSRRRLLGALGLAAAGSAALAACGGGAVAPAASSASAATSAAAATTAASSAASSAATSAATQVAAAPSSSAASAAPAAAPGSVDFWQWGTGYVPGFDTLVKAYNDAGPKGKVGASNPSDYWNKVVTSEAGGAGPDVFLMNNVNFKQWSLTQNVTDLSSYLDVDKAASASLAAMLQSAVDWYHYKGKLMGVPWDYSTGVLIYNTELLKTVNLSSPADAGKSWDWNMLRDYATKLTQKSGSNITRSGVWINNGLENGWYTFSLANGGPFFNDNLDQCIIASPEATAGLEFVLGMIKDGVAATNDFKTAAGKANPQAGGTFINAATAMDFEGDWNFTSYEKATQFSWDGTIFPYSPTTGKTANTSNLRGLVLNPASKNKDNAWAWTAHLMSKAVQDQIPSLFGEVPANNASATAFYLDPTKGGPPPGRKTLQPDLDATSPLPSSDLISWTDINKALSKPLGDAFGLKLAAADALKQAQDTINGIIQTNKSKG